MYFVEKDSMETTILIGTLFKIYIIPTIQGATGALANILAPEYVLLDPNAKYRLLILHLYCIYRMSGLLGEQNHLATFLIICIVIKVSSMGMGHIYFSSNLQRPVWQFGWSVDTPGWNHSRYGKHGIYVARLELELHSVISITVVPAGNHGAIVCCRFK